MNNDVLFWLILISAGLLLYVSAHRALRAYYLNWSKSKTFSFRRARKAAEYGDAAAQYTVGSIFYQRAASGELKDYPTVLREALEHAENLLNKSLSNGHREAAAALFVFHTDNNNPLRNDLKACLYAAVLNEMGVCLKLSSKLDKSDQARVVEMISHLSTNELSEEKKAMLLACMSGYGQASKEEVAAI